MFKNQLQELAQRSCFNLPSYACTREGPDHAPRFKASVNFNGDIFESPTYCTTLRQAEHAAAEVALNALSSIGPSRSLTARVIDETGVYKNLLQETAHRAGLNLPVYTTVRSGPGHLAVFTSNVELAGMNFAGEPAKTKKQAEKNAAIAAWTALKTMPNLYSLSQTSKEADSREGSYDQITVARAVSGIGPQDETRSIRRRYQNQSTRKMVRNFRDSGPKNETEQRDWKLMDLFVDFTKEGITEKHNWFVSLLPPPPPRITSKILPPSCPPHLSKAKSTPVEIMDNSQEIKPPVLDEHYRDDAEWLKGKTEKSLEKESSCKPSSSATHNANHVHRPISQSISGKRNTSLLDHTANISTSVTVPTAPAQMSASPVMASRCTQKCAGGYRPRRIAPAVQIRSVIPVCAAPPPRTILRPSSSDPSVKNEAIPRLATETGSEASLGGSKFNNPQPHTTGLNSTFNKLRV